MRFVYARVKIWWERILLPTVGYMVAFVCGTASDFNHQKHEN